MFRLRDYLILSAAALSFLFSIYLWFNGHRDQGLFVAVWVPSILGFGIYVELRRGGR